jgi:hypothetical protein
VPYFYRIIRGPHLRREQFLSDREAGIPRPDNPELIARWEGFSVFATEAQARRMIRKRPNLGDHLAELDIGPDANARVKRTGRNSPGHHTVYGDPDELLLLVQRVIPV